MQLNILSHVELCTKKKKLLRLGGYNSKFFHREEEELRLRLDKNYVVHNLAIPLYRYRRHAQSLTTNKEQSDLYYKLLCEGEGGDE